MACKPGSVLSYHLSWAAVADGLNQPTPRSFGRACPTLVAGIHGLSAHEACHHGCCQPCRELLPRVFTLTPAGCPAGAVSFLWRLLSPDCCRTGAFPLGSMVARAARTFLLRPMAQAIG